MEIVDKFLIGLVLASWVLFFFARKNIAFGLAVGLSIFSVIYILAEI